MLTLIASEHPRLALHVEVEGARPWRGIVWTGGPDLYGAHWQTRSEGGIPLLLRRRALWRMGYFNLFDREWLLLHAAGRADEDSAWMEFNRRLTRTLMDRFGIPPEGVMSDEEAWERLDVPREGRPPFWDMARFRASL
jgi:hypothetical protein